MELIAFIIVLLLFAGILIYSSFSWGFVLFKFWHWFMMPVFFTLPSISLYQAVGILLFISIFKNKVPQIPIKDEFIDSKKKTNNIVIQAIAPWMVLLMGILMKSLIS